MIGLAHLHFHNNNILKGEEVLKEIGNKILNDNSLLNEYLIEDFAQTTDAWG